MRIVATIARLLMGLLFLFGSVAVMLKLMPEVELTGNVKVFNEGMVASGYLMTLIKLSELACELAFC